MNSNFQKTLFMQRWEKKLEKSKIVTGINTYDDKIKIWVRKPLKTLKNISEWLVDNNYKFDINRLNRFDSQRKLIIYCN
jgi:hypothetical protein